MIANQIAWLFTGQGAQAPGMGEHMYRNHSVFRQTLDQCASLLEPYMHHGLIDALYTDQEPHDANHPIHQTGLTQPALFAFEYAMAKALEHEGVACHGLIGHSVGEIAAATFAGCMSLKDGLMLIACRAQLMQALPPGGGMAAAMCDEEHAQSLCDTIKETTGETLDLAGMNSPKQTVLSGPLRAIDALITHAQDVGIKVKALSVSHAFHSHLMDPMLEAFKTKAATISYRAPSIPLISNVTGTWLNKPPTADYWCTHVRSAVRFTDGMQTLAEASVGTYIEVGPQPILCGLGTRIHKQHGISGATWLGCAHPNHEKDVLAFESVRTHLGTR